MRFDNLGNLNPWIKSEVTCLAVILDPDLRFKSINPQHAEQGFPSVFQASTTAGTHLSLPSHEEKYSKCSAVKQT